MIRAYHTVTLLVAVWLSGILVYPASAVYTPARCSLSAFTSPYPNAAFQLTTSENSEYFATAINSLVTIYAINSLTPNSSTPDIAAVSFTSIPSPCFTATINAVSYTLSPSYAYSAAMENNYLLLSAPNNDQGVTASFIDVVQIRLSSNVITPSYQTIYSDDSSVLGLSLALDVNAGYLVSYHTVNDFIVYHPVWNRQFNTFNNGADDDISVTFPSSFYADSFALNLPTLAVTGMTAVSATGLQPSILIYEATYTAGIVTAWNLISNIVLVRVNDAVDAADNSLPISAFSLPSGKLPCILALDLGNPAVVMGIVDYSSVYIIPISTPTNYTYVRNDDSNGLTTFGSQISISSDSSTILILADQGVVFLSIRDLLNISVVPSDMNDTSQAEVDIFTVALLTLPNRMQYASQDVESFAAFGYSTNASILLPSDRLARLLVVPAITSSSLSYNSTTNEYTQCPPGTYRDLSSINFTESFSPCTFCDIGTYNNLYGASSCIECDATGYCPAGSIYPFTSDELNPEEPEILAPFESESFAENFEDLLINGIFNPTTIPMIIFYCVAGLTVICLILYSTTMFRPFALKVLNLYSWVLLPTEEEEEQKHQFLQHMLEDTMKDNDNLNEKTNTHEQQIQEHNKELHNHHSHHQNNSQEGRDDGHEHISHSGSERPKSANPHLPHADVHHDKDPHNLSAHSLMKLQHEKEMEAIETSEMEEASMKGFFNVMLILFALSSITFSWVYLNNYNPNQVGEDETNNRYRTETLYSVGITEPQAMVVGIQDINAVNATINIHLMGYSGMECQQSSLLGLWLDGCLIFSNNEICNQTQFTTVFEDPTVEATCTISFALVQGTILNNLAVLTLILPPQLQAQAMRFEFIQTAMDTDPEIFVTTGPTQFSETVTQPQDDNGDLIPNALSSYIQRNWEFGIVAQSQQIDENQPPSFQYIWYNTVTALSAPWFPTVPLGDYTTAQPEDIRVVISMVTDTYFRLQQTQMLIEKKAAFLTILLGLIAIFHIVEFGKQMFEVVLLVVKRIRKNRAIKSVTDLTTKSLTTVADITTKSLNTVVDKSLAMTKEVGGKVISTAQQAGEQIKKGIKEPPFPNTGNSRTVRPAPSNHSNTSSNNNTSSLASQELQPLPRTNSSAARQPPISVTNVPPSNIQVNYPAGDYVTGSPSPIPRTVSGESASPDPRYANSDYSRNHTVLQRDSNTGGHGFEI